MNNIAPNFKTDLKGICFFLHLHLAHHLICLQVQDDPKLLGDSGEVPISN